MRTKTLMRLAAGVLLALLLAGCDSDGDGLDDQTGQPVGASAPTPADAVSESLAGLDAPDGGPCPVPSGADFDENGQVDFTSPDTFGFALGSECERHLEQWSGGVADQMLDAIEKACPSGNFADCHDETGGAR